MIVVPAGVKVHLALGYTDMRKGLDGLATLIQEHLKKDPFSGHLFVVRGKKAQLVSLYLPLSDSRQADHPIVLIINVVFSAGVQSRAAPLCVLFPSSARRQEPTIASP